MPNTKLSLEHDLLISDKNLIFWEQNKKARMLKLWKDTDPENPRTGYDNVATMVCFQSEYNLGVEPPRRKQLGFRTERKNIYDKNKKDRCHNHYRPDAVRRPFCRGTASYTGAV